MLRSGAQFSRQNMRYTFCTIVDRGYLYRGLALYQSLVDHCGDFRLWILCMDHVAYSLLEKMRLESVKLVRLEELEDDDLRRVKRDRSRVEYCWTCKAPLVLHVMEKEPGTPHVAWLDSDLMFFSDPGPIYEELGQKSILIVPHRFSPEYQTQEKTNGVYNSGFEVFRNDSEGVASAIFWRERCLEACRLDAEEGLCGDQTYIQDWPSRFQNVVVLENKGANLAPWNIKSYQLKRRDGSIWVDSDQLIFYHYHSLQMGERSILARRPVVAARGYRFTRQQLSIVYSQYISALRHVMGRVRVVAPDFADGYAELGLRELASAFLRRSLLLV